MTAFLIASLYAPIASWGDITVGERRTSWDRPSRSAILGLVAAALGLERPDQAAHDALDQGYGFAVRVDAAGRVMSDYHTAQSVAQTALKKKPPATRRELLLAGDKETILSHREYRVDAAYTFALWAREEPRWTLQQLCSALDHPVFTLYAGRKANPLAWPLRPEIVEASTLVEALLTRKSLVDEEVFKCLADKKPNHISVSADRDILIDHGLEGVRLETRRDASAQRTRWQFAERQVITGLMPPASPNQPAQEVGS
jgi:CRISPR system Cascade subunit CasD